MYRLGPSGVCAGRFFFRYRPPRPRVGTVLCRKWPRMRDKVLPARTGAGVNAKKFAQRTINAPKMAFYGLLGELFRENTGGGVVLGELFRGSAREVGCWANFFAESRQEEVCWESFVPVDPAEPGGRESFVSLRTRCGLHRAFLAPTPRPSMPLSCAAATRGPGGHAQSASGNRIPDPSVMRSSPHANRPPTNHAGADGNIMNAWDASSNKQRNRGKQR